ncbi:MAG: alginate export family protein [Phycisphaerae bacterium]|nr:alginate export family protein [Phycisphaerae bacterium]
MTRLVRRAVIAGWLCWAIPAAQAGPAPTTAPASQPGEGAMSGRAAQGDWFDRSKNPVTWLKWGGDLRARWEYMDNAHTFNKDMDAHERSYYRQRTRIWSTVTPTPDKNIEINSRLAWEFRNYFRPDIFNSGANRGYRDTDMDEVIFDNLNVKLKNLFDRPLDVTVGRQDIKFAEGWLVGDGTGLDGSRTTFFDAARATYNIKPIKTTADLVYIEQRADSDWWIEPFNHREYPLTNQDERGAILYLSNQSLARTTVDGYFIYKHDELASGHESSNPILKPLKKGDAGDIYTFGSRVEHRFDPHWTARGDLAGQFGNKDGADLCALGFNSRLIYDFKDRLRNQLRWNYEFLSGDDPKTKTNEGFDILWGRWTQWSEVMSKAISLENGRPDQYTNMHRTGPGWTFKPTAKGEFSLDYMLLFADENTLAGSTSFSEHGRFRGQSFQAAYRHVFTKHISTGIAGELFAPGNYYSDLRNDLASYFRADVTFTW